jgi:hypothetical protein
MSGLNKPELSDEDKSKVMAITERIAQAIGLENPTLAAHACHRVMLLSIDLAEMTARQK